MQVIEIRTARWFRAVYLVVAAFLIGIGAPVVFGTSDPGARWVAAVILGGVASLCAWTALTRRRELRLDHLGIHGRPFGVVAWGDITRAFVFRNNLNRVLGLNVREPSAYLERLPRWRRVPWRWASRAGFGDLSFDVTGMRISSDDLLRVVRERAGCQAPSLMP